METHIKENIKMEDLRDMEFIPGQMGVVIKGNSKMAGSMEREVGRNW